MKPDTSFNRVVFIVFLCLIVFPFFYQSILQFQANRKVPTKMESFEVLTELDFIKRHINRYIEAENNWPLSLDEANYLSKEQLIRVDLSEPWAISATITDKALYDPLRGKMIKFYYNQKQSEWICDQSATNVPKAFSPASCAGSLDQILHQFSARTWYLLVASLAIIMVILLAFYRHPLLKRLRKNQFDISQHKVSDLNKLQYLSWVTGHNKALLKTNKLNNSTWQQLAKVSLEAPFETINLMKQSLPIVSIKTKQKTLFKITLSDQFELNISDMLVLIVKQKTNNQVIQTINQLTDPLIPILIWLTNPQQNAELRNQQARLNRLCMVPNQTQMTQLLLLKTARNSLIQLAAKSLPINMLSPYQGKGGIIRSSHFFGRQAILDKLATQYRTNFLLVGGRQLGKTSLLKALHRKLSQQKANRCFYISLSDDRLLPRIAHHSGVSHYEDFNDLLAQVKTQNPEKKIRLLIDEADLFIKAEVSNHFKLLNQIRLASEHGTCQFIFAGFWELYAQAVLEYQSPLRNIADAITVGALESHPAHQLIKLPMTMLGQQFESDTLVHDIYEQTGGRANLINLICEYLVEQLTTKKQIIDVNLIKQAYQADPVQDALQGWSNLTADAMACGIDRLIVYLTFQHRTCNLGLINQTFLDHQLHFSPEQLKQSLQRLRLAHIITKQQQHYQFVVPLFAQQHSPAEAQVLMQQELHFLSN